MTSGPDRERNLLEAQRLIALAAREGAKLAVLPENFAFLAPSDARRLEAVEPPGEGPIQAFLSAQAAEHGLWLVGGTVPLAAAGGQAYSASLLLDPEGGTAARYDKIHLFDVTIPGSAQERYRESAATAPGSHVVVVPTPLGRIGMVVCYDLRFPLLFHRLSSAGAEIIVAPSAFTAATGRAHWEILLRARAVESMAYVVAAAQWGRHPGGRETFGHSMVVGPWGEILGRREDGAGVLLADLDMMKLAQLRESFPVLEHRREL